MTLGDTIENHLINLLKEALITSASPGFTNTVKDVRVTGLGAEFDRILDMEIAEKISEYISANPDSLGEEDVFAKSSDPRKQSSEKIATGLVRKGVGVMQNPANVLADLMRVLPHAALVALAVALVPIIFEYLTKPGGLMDVRFKRRVENDFNGFLDRQTQKNTQIGIRGISVQSRAGFIGINGANNANNLREIREGGVNKFRLSQTDLFDHTRGLWN